MKRSWISFLFILILVSSVTIWAENDEIVKANQFWESHTTQGMTEKAIAVLEALVEKEPNNYEALWRLGRYYQFLGEVSLRTEKNVAIQKGLAYAERAVKVNDQGVDGHLWYAILINAAMQEKRDLNSLNLINQRHHELQKVIKLDPQNGSAHYELAQLYEGVPGKPISIGDKKKALKEAGLAVKYTPANERAWMFYGLLAMENNDLVTAKVAYAKFQDITNSYQQYSTLITKENQVGQDYEALFHLGVFYEFYGQKCLNKKGKLAAFEKAATYIDRAINVNPKRIDSHLYRAILIGDIGLAKGLLTSMAMVKPMQNELQVVLRLEPTNAAAHYFLGQLYWRVPGKPLSIGDKKKALAEMALAVEYNPKSIEYWFNYGKVAEDNKNNAIAKTAFNKVLGFFGGNQNYQVEAQQELERIPKG
jgi:tetratricopeptide (TPR) repeat protein